jgi:hypothetical protein
MGWDGCLRRMALGCEKVTQELFELAVAGGGVCTRYITPFVATTCYLRQFLLIMFKSP